MEIGQPLFINDLQMISRISYKGNFILEILLANFKLKNKIIIKKIRKFKLFKLL